MSLQDLTALELGEAIKKGETTAVEAAERCFARIKKMEPEVHAFINLDEERAMDCLLYTSRCV